MGDIVNRRRNIFINSEQYHRKNGDVNIIFPGDDFAVNKNEMMRLSLESFTMKRQFYNINDTNNTFYIRDTTSGQITAEVTIAHADYHTVAKIQAAVQAAINNVTGVSGVVVTSDEDTRKLSIDVTSANGMTNKDFVCLQVVDQTNPNPNVISTQGLFNDSCEILGAKRTNDVNNMIAAFDKNGNVFTSYFPVSLITLEAIHLATNLQTHSYQTPNFDAFSENSKLIPSQIFAKIPIKHGASNFFFVNNYQDTISYVDSGSDAFSVDLQNKSLNSLILRVQDDKGRPLEDFCEPDSLTNGNVNFLATLKWTAINTPEIGQPLGYPNKLQMQLYNL